MTDNLKELPKAEKKVAAKALILNGYSSRKVEEILGIDHQTAINYSGEEIPEEMKEFSTIFDNYIKESKQKGLALVQKRLLELIPRERRIDQVVKAGEYLEGKGHGGNTNVQVNFRTNHEDWIKE